jgi:glycosyltransferase involved in cell wall biosynthesis
MRIFMVSRPCLIGAYQRKLEEIARFHDVELLVVVPSLWREGGRVLHLERAYTEGYELVCEPLVFNGSFHLHFYPLVRRRLRDFAPDIVHIDEEPYNLAAFHTMWLARRLGACTLWFSWQNLNRRYPMPFCYFERFNMRHADYAIAGSQGAAKIWRQKGYRGKIAVIPQFGVDPAIYAPASGKHEIGSAFVIGYAGRLVAEKGCDLLLHAVAGLTGDWRLILLGDGPERENLEGLAHRLDIAERVSFRDWLPTLQLPDFYRALDVFVLPSRSRRNWVEQFGRVLAEAMACGIPVIGSECGEIPHVIEEAGLIFAEEDADALRVCLDRLMHDLELRSVLAQRGRQRVLTHFTQAHIAARTVAVYREMLG